MQVISGDPLQRKTYAFEEDNWHEGVNANFEKTASQINDLQRTVLGDAQASTLDNYSGSSFLDRVQDLESVQSTQGTEIDSIQSTLPTKTDFTQSQLLGSQLALGRLNAEVMPDQTTLPLVSGANADLKPNDTLVLVDLSEETTAELTPASDHSEGTTSINVASGPGQRFPSGTLVMLDFQSVRTGLGLNEVKDAVWGNRGAEGVSGNHEDRLRVLENKTSGFADNLRAITSLARDNVSRFEDLSGAVSEVKATAEGASLQAQTFEVADKPIMKTSTAYDGSPVSSVSVKWTDNAEVGLDQGDLFVFEQRDGSPIYLTVGAGGANVGDAEIPLAESYPIDTKKDAKGYLTITTIASKITARTDGDVVVDGNVLRSKNFDGEIVKDPNDGLYYFDTDNDGNHLTGTQGWAGTSGGEFAMLNAFVRGNVEMMESSVLAKLEIGNDGRITNSLGTWGISSSGMNVQPSSGVHSIDRSFSISDDTVVGQMWGYENNDGSLTREMYIEAGDYANEDAAGTGLNMNATGDLSLYAGSSGSKNKGDLFLSGDRAVRVRTPVLETTLPEVSSATEFVEEVYDLKADYYPNVGSVDDLAKKLGGALFIDTSKGRQVRAFTPSMYTTDGGQTVSPPDKAEVRPQVVARRKDERGVIRAIDASTVEYGVVTERKFIWGDSTAATTTSDGSATHSYGVTGGGYTITLEITVSNNDGTTNTYTAETQVLFREQLA